MHTNIKCAGIDDISHLKVQYVCFDRESVYIRSVQAF